MFGVVAPPSAVVVPEVVEGIVRGPDGEDRPVDAWCAHVGVSLGWHIRNPSNKKPPSQSRAAVSARGEIFCSAGISPPRTSNEFPHSSHRRIFSDPRLAALDFTPMRS